MSLAAVQPVLPPRHCSRDVMQVIGSLRRQNPRIGEDRLAELLADELLDDRELLLDAGRHLVRKALVSARPKSVAKVVAVRRQRIARQEAEEATVKAIVAKVKAALVLDMEIGGKRLRFHTGAEVARLGAGFVKLAKRVPADCLVGEIVTEAEAAALMGESCVRRLNIT
jgi:hypothetical protein